MAIFEPDKKTGEVMGKEGWRRWGKKQKREYAIQKQVEEEQQLAAPESYYARQRVVKKMERKRREMRKAAGLE